MTRQSANRALPYPSAGSRPFHHRRRGTGYVLVLCCAMMLSVIGFAAVIDASVTTRQAVGGNSWAEAGALASSAVEIALAQIANTPDWREQWISGEAEPYIITSVGSMTYAIVDTDDDLADSTMDSVRVYGIGRAGDATRVCAVTLQPAGLQSLEILKSSLHVDGNTYVNKKSLPLISVTGGPLTSNAQIINDNTIAGHVEAVSVVNTNDGTVTGTTTAPAPIKDMPSDDVFDAYAADATVIPFESLGQAKLRNCLLSPTVNPYGAPHPAGSYLLTVPAGQSLTVEDMRFWGTLLIKLEGGSDLEIRSVVMQSYLTNHPVLLVDCETVGSEVEFKIGSGVRELSTNVNLNPVGSPFDGESDDDQDDTYASEINGLLHLIRPDGDSTLTVVDAVGTFVGPFIFDGRVQIDDAILNANTSIFNDPPPGYEVPTHMAVVPGSWQWESLPIAGVTGL